MSSTNVETQKAEVQVFDNSILDVWNTCPRKFYFTRERNLRAIEEGLQLRYGIAIHEGLFAYYNENKSVDAMLSTFITKARELDLPVKLTDADQYTIEWGILVLRTYATSYANEPYSVYRDSTNNPYLEVGFAIDLHEGILVGKIDAIMVDDRTGEIYLMDHKTTVKQLNESFWEKFNPNNQISTYLWSAQEMIGVPLSGFIVNGIRVHQFKRGTAESVRDRMFARLVTTRTEAQLQQRARQVIWQMRVINESRKYGFDAFNQNAPNGCGSGLYRCPFSGLCVAQTENIVNMLIPSFKLNTWHPYEEVRQAKRVEQLTLLENFKCVKQDLDLPYIADTDIDTVKHVTDFELT